ncbi:Gfo/Idh/MocA family oxidoreductase [Rodentibacter trehalosifermentans]|uniref:Oxidoreductase n=1 Tax=Rodentibacter trehalosifermentans TaxID=1908263 RepID=A0A1V3IVJ4_9PAST|nr:Gfo/Idh/MocA family oxidoreductase [Rodentibacter trehalosifermentans]OOF46125.1 oxidoreductase [Rodentibacter trehalosifermentans]OOF47433.1 oxidoreductase [Rodentibacter trehalosifermentans]OOF52173.1 oxidoreductase [Rodentibacter trehalosifermentans]
MKKINVAIAGSGYSTRIFHVPFFKHDPRFNVVKFFERATTRALDWFPPIEIVSSFEKLLTDEVDFIVITTPNQTHYEFVKQALLAQKHVLVEKPLVVSAAQALELATLAQKQGVVLYTYQNRRWDAPVATAREILAQGLIGKPVDCEIRMDRYAKEKNVKAWKETGEKGTGLVYDLGVHLIDQAVSLFGKPQAVFADIRYQHPGALSDDNFDIHLYYENGLKVALKASKYVRETTPYFALHGDLGSYVKRNPDNQEALLNQGVIPQGNWNEEKEADWGILHTELNGEVVRKPYSNAKASYLDLVDNLYHSIVNNAEPAIKTEEVAFVLHIIEKAFESAEKGMKLAL